MKNVQNSTAVTAQWPNILADTGSSIAEPNRRVSGPLPQELQFRSTKTRKPPQGLLIAGDIRSANMHFSETWLVI